MIRNRVIWGIWLAVCFLLACFSETVAPLAFLLVSILAPVVMMVYNRAFTNHVSIQLELDDTGKKTDEIMGTVILENRSVLPVFWVECILITSNLLTGEEVSKQLHVSIAGRTKEVVPISFASEHCGKIEVQVCQLATLDLFGITRRELPETAEKSTLVFPETFVPAVKVGTKLGLDADGTEYSTIKPGFDPSEVFAIRDYRPGDSPKNIHWKLTQKLERMVVKEPGLPLETSYLLVFETSYVEEQKPTPENMDALAEVFCTIAQKMCAQDVQYVVGWQDSSTKTFRQQKVQTIDDLLGVLPHILHVTQSEESAVEHYSAVAREHYANLLYFTSFMPGNMSELLELVDRMTLFLCQPEDEVAVPADERIELLAFYASNYQQELNYVAV